MSAPSPSPQTAAAVGNALRGAPAFAQVEFPTTGDPEADAISGCLAVIRSLQMDFAHAATVFHYLFEREARDAKAQAELGNLHNPWGQTQPIGMGAPGTGGQPATPPWYTTVGGVGASSMPALANDTRPGRNF